MELPEEITEEAKRRASLDNDKVVVKAFIEHYNEQKHRFNRRLHEGKSNEDLIKGHCRCDYCVNLRKYVRSKMQHHSLKKLLYNDTYPIDGGELRLLFWELSRLKDNFSYYKREKDRIKKELNL